VFLNVPFDRPYERLFVALVAGLTGLGLKPRCVLEITERGEGRLQRVLTLLCACRVSIHDLSRVQTSVINGRRVPRFNMPFELGQAVMLRAFQPHDVHVFESTRHRLALSVSDLGGIDPLSHGDDPRVVSRQLLGAFAPTDRLPSLAELETVRLEVSRVARRYKRQHETDTIFEAAGFRILTAAASDVSSELDLLAR
jgi:hypothetical protein